MTKQIDFGSATTMSLNLEHPNYLLNLELSSFLHAELLSGDEPQTCANSADPDQSAFSLIWV